MDFTLIKYQELLVALKKSGVSFRLRHDVDMLPQNSLQTAQIENALGLSSTYYFRMVPESYNEDAKAIDERIMKSTKNTNERSKSHG